MAPKSKPAPAKTPAKAPAKAAAPAKAKPSPKQAALPKQQPKKKEASKKKGSSSRAKKVKQVGVYIRNLDFEGMNHETITEAFKACGPITEVRLRHGRYVLIFFRGKEAAKKAVELNDKTVKGNEIKVAFAKRTEPTRKREHYCTTVWVGGLPGGTTKKQLRAHFESAGKILKVRIYKLKHYGLVYFENNRAAKNAVALAEKPFAHGKDVTKLAPEEVPLQWQRKLELKFSIRTKEFDRQRAIKRFNRRPPSYIAADLRKSRSRRKARLAAAARVKSGVVLPKVSKSTDKKKKGKGKGSKHVSKTAVLEKLQGSSTKKGSTTKKGSSTVKAGSSTKKVSSTKK